jgi:hypothetical protein
MSGAAPKKYQQRRPEQTVLYRVIQQHLESFLEHAHESSGKRLPKYVENEFRRYLEGGLHAPGFARAICADAVHGAHCGFGAPTAPSIGALLRSVGAAPPVAQQTRDSDSEDEAVHLLRPERRVRDGRNGRRLLHRRG